MNTSFQKPSLAWLLTPVLLCAIAGLAHAQDNVPARPAHTALHFANYDSEPRLPDGHVDGDTLLARLKELHVPPITGWCGMREPIGTT